MAWATDLLSTLEMNFQLVYIVTSYDSTNKQSWAINKLFVAFLEPANRQVGTRIQPSVKQVIAGKIATQVDG